MVSHTRELMGVHVVGVFGLATPDFPDLDLEVLPALVLDVNFVFLALESRLDGRWLPFARVRPDRGRVTLPIDLREGPETIKLHSITYYTES